MKIKFTGILLLAVLLGGCIKEGLEDCPPAAVRLHIYAEKFQNKSDNALDDRENVFTDRIVQLEYYLYRDGVFKEKGEIKDFPDKKGNSHILQFTGLEPGEYEIVLLANSTGTALSGDQALSSNLLLTYPGSGLSEDYFSAVYSFTVKEEQNADYDIGLSRTHGVIRYNFINMPAEAAAVELRMNRISNEKFLTGNYRGDYTAVQRFPVTRTKADEGTTFTMGTFPSLPSVFASYTFNLYREGETEPFMTSTLPDGLTVKRNQLLDITTTFKEGRVFFEVTLNNSWEGWVPGGDTPVN